MSIPPALRTLGYIFFWIITPLLIGWWLALRFVPQPAVGIIRLNGDIWFGSTELVKAQIEKARQNDNIKAVIVQINSGGGEVVASQTLYLELQNLRREMPVVGSIDAVAASGAYYAAVGTEPIYAKPSSVIGNVGAWAYIPPDLAVNDVILASGPFKLTASNQAEFVREIDGIRQDFLAAVFSQRGEHLQLTPAELSQGLAYSGRDATRLGLADQIGSQSEAIKTAADQAGIANYEVIDLEIIVIKEFLENSPFASEIWPGTTDPDSGERKLSPGIYLLYDPLLRGTP